mgnify:FL=1|tara:strand:- start:1812 stop:2183 length:372 start_codon:yes stop_codon:yes gene_type:complete
MKINKNFSLKEFDCKDGTVMPENVKINILELAKNLQILRDYLGLSIKINSAYRSASHNKKIGGVKNSQHVKGRASDIVVKGMSSIELAKAIELLIKNKQMSEGGIGIYTNFVHYDIRGTKARW